MKKFLKLRMFLTALVLGVFCLNAMAQPQHTPPLVEFPLDQQIRYGVLENGLTYYIRHNELPKDRAEFYIAQKVGSMLEEDNQRGLAHFLEHMAFNGTTNFPDKAMLEYLESIGAKFGANINAYTSMDETVYTLMNIPVTRPEIVDSCLLVLHDWSCGIALLDEEIDAERGVIREEWRTGMGAQMRIIEQILPTVFEGSRYGHRLPIGTMDVIDNFSYQTLRDYYHKWYRPDQQGIIIVGDVDVDYVEAKIKEMFSGIKMPEDPAQRVYFEVPDNKEPIVAFATDKEATDVRTSIYYKHDPIDRFHRNGMIYYIRHYLNSMVSSMTNARLSELVQKANPPFLYATVYDGPILGISKTKEAFTAFSVSDETNIERALRTLLTEVQRVDEHGFTVSEYERAKASFLTRIETSYNEREKQRNGTYANEYIRVFVDNEPAPGIEIEWEIFNQLAQMIPLEAINQHAKELITEENIVFVMQGPDKEGINYPSKEEIIAIHKEVRNTPVEAYAEEISDEPLISQLPKAGSIVKTEKDEIFDATVWTLSNGAKVVIKPTKFKADQISMKAMSHGGSSLIGSQYNNEVEILGTVGSVGGLGNFSTIDLRKVLAGKNARVSASVSEMAETVSASASPKDLETMMELVYLQFTGIRQDNEAFESWRSREITTWRNLQAEPNIAYQDSLYRTMYNHHPRMRIPSPETIEKADYETALKLFRERFADASDFVFTFVGNVDENELKPLVEQYIASLPSTHSKEKAGTPVALAQGKVNNTFTKMTETAKVSATIIVSADIEASMKNNLELDMLSQILRSRYTETMREDEGGTYGASVQMVLPIMQKEGFFLIMFDTNEAQFPRLEEIAFEEIEKIAKEGPSDVDFNKIKEYMLKKRKEDLQENSHWMNYVSNYHLYGIDYMTGYDKVLNATTKADIQKLAKKMLDSGNVIEVIMNSKVTE